MKALLAGLSLVLTVGCTFAAAPTATPTASKAYAVSATATPIPTPERIFVSICNTGGAGAYIRTEPNGSGIIAYPDGTRLQVEGPDRNADGAVWRHVQDDKGVIGWTKTDYLCPTQ